jgi:hypothetical protein
MKRIRELRELQTTGTNRKIKKKKVDFGVGI